MTRYGIRADDHDGVPQIMFVFDEGTTREQAEAALQEWRDRDSVTVRYLPVRYLPTAEVSEIIGTPPPVLKVGPVLKKLLAERN